MPTRLEPSVRSVLHKTQLSGKKNLAGQVFDAILQGSLLVMAFLTPLLFFPLTSDVTELQKQSLFFILLGFVLVGWLGVSFAEGKMNYKTSPVTIIAGAYLVFYAISTFLSANVGVSLLGDSGQEKTALITLFGFVALVVLVSARLEERVHYVRQFVAMIASGLLLGLTMLLQGAGLHLWPFSAVSNSAFTPVGTPAALGLFLAFTTLLSGGLLLGHESSSKSDWGERGMKILLYVSGIVSLLYIISLDFWPVNLALFIGGLVMLGYAFLHAERVRGLAGVSIPVISVTVALLLLVLRIPSVLQYPTEVYPTLRSSAAITWSSLKNDPMFGSGPGTFLYDYAKYRDSETNNTSFWYLRFDRSGSRLLTQIATTGLLPSLLMLALIVVVLATALRKLVVAKDEDWHLLLTIFSAWLVLLVGRIVYSTSFTLELFFWIGIALLAGLLSKRSVTLSFRESPRTGMAVSFLSVLVVVASLAGYTFLGQRYIAETAYARALAGDSVGEPADVVIANLSRAVALRPKNDTYWRNLALAYLKKAGEDAVVPNVKKKEGESDEDFTKRTKALQQQHLTEISASAQRAIAAAKAATDIAPGDVTGWTVTGAVYARLIGVADGAEKAAIDAYTKASELDPHNPALLTEIGKAHAALAGAKGIASDTEKDAEKKKALEAESKSEYAQAEKSFSDALALKSDYATAHYYLSLVLDEQGKTKDAIKKMESALTYDQENVGLGLRLALLYFRDGRKDEARQLLEGVIAVNPKYSNARWYLASMYEDAGQLAKAVEQLQEVAKLNPGNAEVADRLAKLGQGSEEELPQPLDDSQEEKIK